MTILGELAWKSLGAPPYLLGSPPEIQLQKLFSSCSPADLSCSASRVAILQLLSLLPEAVGGTGEPGVRDLLHSLPVYPMIYLQLDPSTPGLLKAWISPSHPLLQVLQ